MGENLGVTTKVATKVSTKTKVLLALVMLLAAGGMFAIIGGLGTQPKTIIKETKQLAVSELAVKYGETKQEQYVNIGKSLGLSADAIKNCIEFKKCSEIEQIKGIVGVGTNCICSKSCAYDANSCSNCSTSGSCSVTCGSGNNAYTLTGTCRNSAWIKIGNTTIYF